MKFVKYAMLTMVGLVVLMMMGMVGRSIYDRQIDYDVALGGTVVPKYTEFELPQIHLAAGSLPCTAGAVLDINGDGVDELFLGGGLGQADVIYKFDGKGFVEVPNVAGIKKPMEDASLGALVFDANKDGKQDLLVTRTNGIWLYTNLGGTFEGKKLDAPMAKDTSPVSVAIVDINRDGHFDMYVSGYIRSELIQGLNIFNKEGYGGTSALLVNRGDNTFEDQTKARGLYYKHNTFQAAFIDFDLDGDLDLIVAHDTGQVKTWENTGSGKFKELPNPNSGFYSYPMGIAIGDYDNDGLVDFFFSNVGSTPPHFMVKGDLRDDQRHMWKWLMFRNTGKLGFEDTAAKVKLADYEFAWGAVFEDLNLDGREDLIVSQNFVAAPFHKFSFMRLPGRLFVQTPKGEFAEVGAEAGVVNKRYSIAPVTTDFNGDGLPDIVHVNIDGKSKVFLSKAGGANGYLRIRLPDDVSSIGALVKITLDDGRILHKPYVSGEGLASDSSHVITAGLGKAASAIKIEVTYIGKAPQAMTGKFRNKTVTIKGAE